MTLASYLIKYFPNCQEIKMPETDRNELSTAQITSKLAQLKLVKDRSIKDIDTNLNEEETKTVEARKSLDDNTDDDEDVDPPPDKEESVCVKKIMQVRLPPSTLPSYDYHTIYELLIMFSTLLRFPKLSGRTRLSVSTN